MNEAMSHKITDGGDYGWRCWDNARFLDYQSDYAFGYVTFNFKTQEIYVAEITHKDESLKPYRWFNPKYKQQYLDECKQKNVDPGQAWDDVKWVDLEEETDFLEKAIAIFNGESFDERVQVTIDLPNDELLQLAMEAHKRDITINKMVEIILQEVIDKHKDVNRELV